MQTPSTASSRQERLHRLNAINIFSTNPDNDYDTQPELHYEFLRQLLPLAHHAGLTVSDVRAIDNYLSQQLVDDDEDIDVNWTFLDDSYVEPSSDTCSSTWFIQNALAARATALAHRHRFVIIDLYLDIILTHLYLTMLQEHDYRLQYYRDYAEALTIACSNLDLYFYSLI